MVLVGAIGSFLGARITSLYVPGRRLKQMFGPNCDVRIGAVPATFSVGNLDVESVFSDEGITEGDLRAGKYNFAEVRMFLVNFQDLAQGILKLRRGWLGEVTIRDGMYVAELRGMTQRLQMTVV